MSFRPVSYQYTETVDYSVFSTLLYMYAVPPATTPVQYQIDGTVLGFASDLPSLRDVLGEFRADDLDGTLDPTDLVKRTAGGLKVVRSDDLAFVSIGTRPPVVFARAMALLDMLLVLYPVV